MKKLIFVLSFLFCSVALADMTDLSYLPTGYLLTLGDSYAKTQTLMNKFKLKDTKSNLIFASIAAPVIPSLPKLIVSVEGAYVTKDRDFFTNDSVKGWMDPTLKLSYRVIDAAEYLDVDAFFTPKMEDHKVATKDFKGNELNGANLLGLNLIVGKKIAATDISGSFGILNTFQRTYVNQDVITKIDNTTDILLGAKVRYHFTDSAFGNLGLNYNFLQDWTEGKNIIAWKHVYDYTLGAGYKVAANTLLELNFDFGNVDLKADTSKIEKEYVQSTISLAYQF